MDNRNQIEMGGYPEMISLREAARRTGLSYGAIRQMINQQKLSCLKVGKKFLINAYELLELLNGGRKIGNIKRTAKVEHAISGNAKKAPLADGAKVAGQLMGKIDDLLDEIDQSIVEDFGIDETEIAGFGMRQSWIAEERVSRIAGAANTLFWQSDLFGDDWAANLVPAIIEKAREKYGYGAHYHDLYAGGTEWKTRN